jgi:hypothetical protein
VSEWLDCCKTFFSSYYSLMKSTSPKTVSPLLSWS